MSFLVEVLGWTGSSFYIISSASQAISVIRSKSARGLSWGLVALLFIGSCFSLAYAIYQHNWPLSFNFFISSINSSILFFYKILEHKK